jgi:hypothetical protein
MAALSSADNIGYARASALDRRLDAQPDAPKRVGCVKLFSGQSCGFNAVCA